MTDPWVKEMMELLRQVPKRKWPALTAEFERLNGPREPRGPAIIIAFPKRKV
jgi:hypothetical protein